MGKILIIEDEPLIASDIKRIVQKHNHEVVGICYNSDQALDEIAKQNYDIVLLDINLKGTRNGIQLAQIINEKYKVPFIYITSYADRDTIEKVKKTMPAGYIVKPFNAQEIYSTIEIALYRNDQNVEEKLTLPVLNRRLDAALTEKEFNIVMGILDGLTNIQMAQKHYVSENTIKSHIKNIYLKLGTHSRTQLVAAVLQKGGV